MIPVNALKIQKGVNELLNSPKGQELAVKYKQEEAKKVATQRLGELKKETRNRNLVIGGYMVVGALGGFFIARYMKAKTMGLVLSTIGGSLALGVPYILITRKKAVARRTEAETLNKSISGVVETSLVDDAVKAVEDLTKAPVKPTTQIPSTVGLPQTLTGLNTPAPKIA